MLQLTYISTAVPGLSADSIEEILLTSRRRNMAAGVTGLLVFDGRRFLQALEGDEPRVTAAFDRISADRRHRAVVLLSRREVPERQFGDWSMAAQVAVAPAAGETLAEEVDALTETLPDANARAHFRSFARLPRAA